MSSNFHFLNQEWPELYQRAMKAEELVITDPRTSLTYARMALELAVNWMFTNDSELEMPYDTSLNSLMKSLPFIQQFSQQMYKDIDLIRKTGNLAIHNKPVSETDSDTIILNLYYFTKWFAKSYSQENIALPSLFDGSLIPAEGAAILTKKQIDALQSKFNSELNTYQEELKNSEARNTQLEEENELFKLQIEQLQQQIAANKLEATNNDLVIHPRNEAETRKFYIDVSLREAGWDLAGINDREFKVNYMPVSTNKSETGFVDYVLWDDNGKPLALVEAKKSIENPRLGENQAQLYADSLEKMFGQRPVMFYTNGFETFIWDDQFYKAARKINGFYTKQELQTLHFRRSNRHDIRYETIDGSIAGRHYQLRAIKSIAEHFAGNDKSNGKLIGTNRGALLVLATGTGKTRTAIAFSKVMMQANWAKRILFLADRKSLVRQAKRNFVKLLPDHKSVNLLEEKDNIEARFAFSTYQTMMGLIDGARDNEKRYYGVGHFDLIIIDEAHRSIYKKYQAIFEYFDALFLGLTATPKNNIDQNTYEIFGLPDQSPTDAYTFEEAVENKHLVPYKTIELSTKFLTSGIRYKDLSKREQEAFEEDILDGEEATGNEWIDSSALNNWLFNKDTTLKTLEKIVEFGIKKRGGDELGKTILFAKSKKHAQFLKDMFLELDKELYSNDYVKVITNGEPKAEEFIERFCDEEKERMPQIVISVDMMDTGIDAPSCVNLVFYKPVKSYAKFWQMIGRGSRLRPDLFGPGEDKTHFLIFDLCGNFEFFSENPNGIDGSVQKSLTEQVFNLKLKLAEYLKEKSFSDKTELVQFRHELLDNLYHEVAALDKDRFDVRMKLSTVLEYGEGKRNTWDYLESRDIQNLTTVIAPLIRSSANESDLARFYDKMIYRLIIERLETPNTDKFIDDCAAPINKLVIISKKLLRKTAIPEVKKLEAIVQKPLVESFWKTEGISHLEELRSNVRNLMKYLDFDDHRFVTTNFEDQVFVTGDGMNEPTNWGDSGLTFINNTYRLEEIIRENANHLTINRIKNKQPISEAELNELEQLIQSKNFDRKKFEDEIGEPLNLVQFIRNVIGLDNNKVDEAFAEFMNANLLNSVQIEFLNTIKLFLTENGKIDPTKLYDAPFKNYHALGIDGVFNEQQSNQIFNIIDDLNDSSHSA